MGCNTCWLVDLLAELAMLWDATVLGLFDVMVGLWEWTQHRLLARLDAASKRASIQKMIPCLRTERYNIMLQA